MTEIRVTSEAGHWVVSRDGVTVATHGDLLDARRHARQLADDAETASVEIDYPVVGFSSMLSL